MRLKPTNVPKRTNVPKLTNVPKRGRIGLGTISLKIANARIYGDINRRTISKTIANAKVQGNPTIVHKTIGNIERVFQIHGNAEINRKRISINGFVVRGGGADIVVVTAVAKKTKGNKGMYRFVKLRTPIITTGSCRVTRDN